MTSSKQTPAGAGGASLADRLVRPGPQQRELLSHRLGLRVKESAVDSVTIAYAEREETSLSDCGATEAAVMALTGECPPFDRELFDRHPGFLKPVSALPSCGAQQ
jgi:hypothetical protein